MKFQRKFFGRRWPEPSSRTNVGQDVEQMVEVRRRRRPEVRRRHRPETRIGRNRIGRRFEPANRRFRAEKFALRSGSIAERTSRS